MAITTSASRSATTPSIANSYQRITGGTPTISASGGQGPKLKSIFDAANERASAEQMIKERMLPRELEYEKKKQLGMRDVEESLDPGKRFQREEYELGAKAKQEDFLKRNEEMKQWIRNQSAFQGQGQPGGAKMTPELAGRYQAQRAAQEQENARRQAEAYRQAYAQAASPRYWG